MKKNVQPKKRGRPPKKAIVSDDDDELWICCNKVKLSSCKRSMILLRNSCEYVPSPPPLPPPPLLLPSPLPSSVSLFSSPPHLPPTTPSLSDSCMVHGAAAWEEFHFVKGQSWTPGCDLSTAWSKKKKGGKSRAKPRRVRAEKKGYTLTFVNKRDPRGKKIKKLIQAKRKLKKTKLPRSRGARVRARRYEVFRRLLAKAQLRRLRARKLGEFSTITTKQGRPLAHYLSLWLRTPDSRQKTRRVKVSFKPPPRARGAAGRPRGKGRGRRPKKQMPAKKKALHDERKALLRKRRAEVLDILRGEVSATKNELLVGGEDHPRPRTTKRRKPRSAVVAHRIRENKMNRYY